MSNYTSSVDIADVPQMDRALPWLFVLKPEYIGRDITSSRSLTVSRDPLNTRYLISPDLVSDTQDTVARTTAQGIYIYKIDDSTGQQRLIQLARIYAETDSSGSTNVAIETSDIAYTSDMECITFWAEDDTGLAEAGRIKIESRDGKPSIRIEVEQMSSAQLAAINEAGGISFGDVAGIGLTQQGKIVAVSGSAPGGTGTTTDISGMWFQGDRWGDDPVNVTHDDLDATLAGLTNYTIDGSVKTLQTMLPAHDIAINLIQGTLSADTLSGAVSSFDIGTGLEQLISGSTRTIAVDTDYITTLVNSQSSSTLDNATITGSYVLAENATELEAGTKVTKKHITGTIDQGTITGILDNSLVIDSIAKMSMIKSNVCFKTRDTNLKYYQDGFVCSFMVGFTTDGGSTIQSVSDVSNMYSTGSGRIASIGIVHNIDGTIEICATKYTSTDYVTFSGDVTYNTLCV